MTISAIQATKVKKKFIVVGAGRMAQVRTNAFLKTGKTQLIGVVSRTLENAEKFCKKYSCKNYCTDYTRILPYEPDFILVEVPHLVQDQIVLWALDQKLNVFIGGCLASTLNTAIIIRDKTFTTGAIIEAGFEARYKKVWKKTREWINDGILGELIAIQSVALCNIDPASWYYNQEKSGGMPVTHMTYAFINPVRWILGEPIKVSAFSNNKRTLGVDTVIDEVCTANLLFSKMVQYTMLAGYVKPGGNQTWKIHFLGTKASLEIFPSDNGHGYLKLFRNKSMKKFSWYSEKHAFIKQAETYLGALDGFGECLNSPQKTVGDIAAAEAICRSSLLKQTVDLQYNHK